MLFRVLSVSLVRSLVKKSPAALKARSASTLDGGIERSALCNAVNSLPLVPVLRKNSISRPTRASVVTWCCPWVSSRMSLQAFSFCCSLFIMSSLSSLDNNACDWEQLVLSSNSNLNCNILFENLWTTTSSYLKKVRIPGLWQIQSRDFGINKSGLSRDPEIPGSRDCNP